MVPEEVQINYQETNLHKKGAKALEQADQRRCGVSSLDCVEKSCRYDSSGHSGEHAGDAKLIVGLDNLKGLSNLNYSIVL